METPDSGRGWHKRGYLPHFDRAGVVQGITFRLHDSVPEHVIASWKRELNWIDRTRHHGPFNSGNKAENLKEELVDDLNTEEDEYEPEEKNENEEPGPSPGPEAERKEQMAGQRKELHRRIAAYEDAGAGDCWLKRPPVASLMVDALTHFDGQRYNLLAWCVMPNHVHVLTQSLPGHAVGDVVHSWKRFSAREANRQLNRVGQPFWALDYYDRCIRDQAHFERARNYIHRNPVKAGLCATPEQWPWSSAARINK